MSWSPSPSYPKSSREISLTFPLRPVVDSTIAVLEVLQTSAGPQLKQVYDSIQNCIYKEIKLQDTELLRISFHKDQREYITKLTSNLHKRFDPSSLSMLEHLNGLLNPALLDTTTRGLRRFLWEDSHDQRHRSS